MSSRPERPSRYRSLFALLEATTADEIALTYDMVAALIGGPLPNEALTGSAWWRRRALPQVRAWRALGWVAHPSAAQMRVRFTRDAEEG